MDEVHARLPAAEEILNSIPEPEDVRGDMFDKTILRSRLSENNSRLYLEDFPHNRQGLQI